MNNDQNAGHSSTDGSDPLEQMQKKRKLQGIVVGVLILFAVAAISLFSYRTIGIEKMLSFAILTVLFGGVVLIVGLVKKRWVLARVKTKNRNKRTGESAPQENC